MKRNSMTRRVIKVALCLLVSPFLIIDCSKTTDTPGDPSTTTDWISAFSSIATPVTDSSATDLVVYSGKDPSGNLYLSGTAGSSWTVLKSTDNGATWAQEFSVAGSLGYGVASDSLGNVFTVGATGSTTYTGVIRKYSVGSGTWSTVFTGQVQTGKNTFLEGVAVDKNDNIYAVGAATKTLPSPDGYPDMDVTQMIVLKSADHGSTWNVVHASNVDDHSFTIATGALVAASGDIYVYATADIAGGSVIQKSTDGGTTWVRVFEDPGSMIRSMAEWNGGFIINEDYYKDGTNSPPTSRVRGTTDGFLTMQALDSFLPTGATTNVTGLMRVDANSYVYYSTHYVDADSICHLITRATRGDGTWSTIDDFPAGTGECVYANDLLFDNNQGVFTIGVYQTAWIARKASLQSTDAFTPPSMSGGTDLDSPIPAGAKRIFMTSGTHNGNWGSGGANSIANADAFCNSDPNKPLINRTATYKALIVGSTRIACTTANCGGGPSEHTDWVLAPNTNYVTREGKALGTTNSNAIFTAFNRQLVTNTVYLTWTGTNSAQDWRVDDYWDGCADWTLGDNSDYGAIWTPRGATFGDIYSPSWQFCDKLEHLLCVEQ